MKHLLAPGWPVALGLAAFAAFSPSANADLGVNFTAPVAGGFSNFGNYSLGWAFEALTPITVTALGYYNAGADNHPVAIFQQGDTTALASATVTPSDPMVGQWSFQSLADPLTLTAGSEYFIQGISATENYAYFVTGLTVNPNIELQGGYYYSPPGSGLLYPNVDASSTYLGFFGPNFETSPLPEPSLFWGILSFSVLLVLTRAWRRRSGRAVQAI